ncbi:MAG: pantoate--beta-alanine ligase [Aeromicrobium sp.]|uniref:pantoate--beta-alanine ligase n=1 Tax=Aeromicrobium sp. TaxID=1871063 RepID=UPI0025C2218F|nr:pantoate--beta-alanine ligase [Aeromicrobium sp.]MCK5892003.1 pantoate--beta-alanine ligase [Aeromicrobium sp.]MDF1704337.1 pantoate--beta-alanine ligase [Aeromicrobium sp.]
MSGATGPRVVRTVAELRAVGGTIALVPTMGALHDGHVQLMKHARPLADTLVASIFVNPTQFAAGEDFGEYPRTWDEDLQRCEEAGVDVVFAPDVATMYPHGTDDQVTVDPGPLGAILEGAQRPTHFRGVLTVVAKLFGLVRPDVAVFGEKDYQQLTLIRLMAEALCLDVEVVGCPTVREADGLALSSRNRYLTSDERTRAVALSQALAAGTAAASAGPDAVRAAATARLAAFGVEPDYVAVTSPDLGDPGPGEARLLIAARVGKPRLLDNCALTLGADAPGNPPEGS